MKGSFFLKRITTEMKLLFLMKILAIPVVGLFLLGAVIFVCHRTVENASTNRLYTSAGDVPKKKAALVLGCAKILADGRKNTYFRYRIDAAASLYKSGKCDYLIVSGDNSRKDYDEPTDMQNALVSAGVPARRIYRDFAGFRTLDSVVRAREIFGQRDIIVVSQAFHNKRAIYLAKKFDMEAVGLNCRETTSAARLKTRIREYLARVKMILDVYILRTPPKYLGPAIRLGDPPPRPGS